MNPTILRSKTNMVVKSNRLNSALQNLTHTEIRLVQLGIVDARDSGKGLDPSTPLVINALRFAEVFGTTRQNAYTRIKETEETLFNRRFSFIDDEGKVVKSRWLSQVRYLDQKGEIEICFTPAVVQGISRIDGAVEFFTQYSLEQTAKLDSVYATRLYELLSQWKTAKNTPVFELATFRGQLGLQTGEYTRMFDFKKRVLDMAVNEVNNKTDLQVRYEQKKQGKQIMGFVFTVLLKKSDTPLKDISTDPPSWQLKGLSDAQIKKLAIYHKEFIDANAHQIAPNDHRDYAAIFAAWRPRLKDPAQVNSFYKIQELLARRT